MNKLLELLESTTVGKKWQDLPGQILNGWEIEWDNDFCLNSGAYSVVPCWVWWRAALNQCFSAADRADPLADVRSRAASSAGPQYEGHVDERRHRHRANRRGWPSAARSSCCGGDFGIGSVRSSGSTTIVHPLFYRQLGCAVSANCHQLHHNFVSFATILLTASSFLQS